jgi:hypothetical protein
MTRLINGDELRENMLYVMCGTGYQSDVLMEIDMMPTVDAIPIEWILKWKEKFENAYSDEYDPTVAEMLVDMLEDWQKGKKNDNL